MISRMNNQLLVFLHIDVSPKFIYLHAPHHYPDPMPRTWIQKRILSKESMFLFIKKIKKVVTNAEGNGAPLVQT